MGRRQIEPLPPVNGEAVRAIRVRLGLSQPELARRCRIGQGSLSNIERGWRQPGPEVMRALLDQLGVSVEAITGEDIPEPETAAAT